LIGAESAGAVGFPAGIEQLPQRLLQGDPPSPGLLSQALEHLDVELVNQHLWDAGLMLLSNLIAAGFAKGFAIAALWRGAVGWDVSNESDCCG
jgi:hypothetical protein